MAFQHDDRREGEPQYIPGLGDTFPIPGRRWRGGPPDNERGLCGGHHFFRVAECAATFSVAQPRDGGEQHRRARREWGRACSGAAGKAGPSSPAPFWGASLHPSRLRRSPAPSPAPPVPQPGSGGQLPQSDDRWAPPPISLASSQLLQRQGYTLTAMGSTTNVGSCPGIFGGWHGHLHAADQPFPERDGGL